ncbi:MAG TPA: multidrug effflux MFS transporter [Gammaproteobacteria bacterium]
MDDVRSHLAGARAGVAVPRYLIVFFGALAALGPLSMDAYLPAMPVIAEQLGVTIVQLNNTLSVFLLGYAVGQFFGGAFSDQIGRKRVGYIGLALYVAAAGLIALADSVEQMLVLRFFQAIGGGFSTVVCMASVRDVYPLHELGKRFATVTMILLVAPLVAPVLGAALLPLGWHSIFVFKAAYALVLLVVYVFRVPETRVGHWRDLSIRSSFVQCAAVVTRRVDGRRLPVRYALAMALSASMLMTFVTNASFVYMEYFGVSAARFPLLFGLSVLGFMSMNLFSMRRLKHHNAPQFFHTGLRVQIAALAGLVAVVALTPPSLATVVPLIVVAMSTLGVVGPAGSAQYMSFFERLAGSASSVHTTLMFSLGALLGALAGVFYDGTLLPVALVMALASAGANAVALTLPRELPGASS